jgi:leucyl-tRNA synthetase
MLGETSNLLREPWPQYDPELAKEDELEIVIQVNGKIRSHITVPADASEDQITERALADEKAQVAMQGKQVVKIIVVKGKLVNIVVK